MSADTTNQAVSMWSTLKTPGGMLYTAFAVGHSILLVAIPLLLGRVVDTLVAGEAPYRSFTYLAAVAFVAPVLQDFALILKRSVC